MTILRKGQAERTKYDASLSVIDDLRKEMDGTKRARIPHIETRERLDRVITGLIERNCPDAYFASFQNAEGEYATLPETFDLGTLAYIMGKKQFLDKVMAGIEANGHAVGLGAAERAKHLEKLKSRLAAAERDAELEVLRLERSGYTIIRRADANVQILLSVWGEMDSADAKPAAAKS